MPPPPTPPTGPPRQPAPVISPSIPGGDPTITGREIYDDAFLTKVRNVFGTTAGPQGVASMPPPMADMPKTWTDVDPFFKEKKDVAQPREVNTSMEAMRHVKEIVDYESPILPEEIRNEFKNL